MDDGMKPFEGLLREVGRASDERAGSTRAMTRAAASKAVARWESRRAWRVPAVRATMALAAAAALAVMLILGAVRRSGDALSFVVGESGEPGKVGQWMASPPGGLPLRFSEGTEIVLQAGTSARVAHADAHGADLLLERGAVRASVVHRDAATGWTVHAGPFEIRIVGTSFDAAWDPADGSLDVGVSEGRVMVTGPLLDDGRAVSTSERLRVSLKTSRFEMTKTATPFTVPSESPKAVNEAASGAPVIAPAPAPSADPGLAAAQPSPSASSQASASPHASASSSASSGAWRDLARSGQHKAALEAVMAAGFGRVLAESSGPDLLLLADSARFAGDAGHAKQALLAARGRGEKGRTAFLLGKIAADSSSSPGEATQWFETYLAEAPGGGLAEQALGRLIELYRRTGRAGQAQQAATKYLEKYPSGGYANAAKSVLGQ